MSGGGGGAGAAMLFNPLLPAYRQDPHPFLHRLRAADPVHRSPVLGVWVLTRYADVHAALRDERFSADARHWENHQRFFFRSGAGAGSPLADAYANWMLQLDPPDHTRLRALVNRAFTPQIADMLAPRVQRAVDELLARVLPAGRMDVVADLAYPLPILVICELLGVPASDHGRIEGWSRRMLPSFSPAMSAAAAREVGEAIESFRDYVRFLARQRRAEPRQDLISALIAAREQGDRLSEDELLSTCILIAFAGHASTVQLIAGAVLALLENRGELERLRRDPARLIGPAIEESIRYVSPLQLVYRTTTVASGGVEVGGTATIPPKQMVFLSLAAANCDPAQFVDPDRFDIARAENRHLGFGYGIHYCAGAPLARTEGRIAVATLLRRAAHLELDGPPTREPSLLLRGLSSLPIRFESAPA
jgi:cytochrome P450